MAESSALRACPVRGPGPLARMWINGDYTNGISMLDRIVARALETKKIADAMDGWLDELVPGAPTYQTSSIPEQAVGVGLDRSSARRFGPLDECRKLCHYTLSGNLPPRPGTLRPKTILIRKVRSKQP